MSTNRMPPRPVVHLELHTRDQVRASAFYAELLYWRSEVVRAPAGSYLALDTGALAGDRAKRSSAESSARSLSAPSEAHELLTVIAVGDV
jgi:predicted enzyme related to lactoylglutathione lyase